MENLKLTHNEYVDYTGENLKRVYDKNNVKYSRIDYLKDMMKVDIIPYDLSIHNLPERIEKAINNIFIEETIDENKHRTLLGFYEGRDEWTNVIERLEFDTIKEFDYSGYCYSEKYNMYMTYFEGELYLNLFKNKEEYERYIKQIIMLYEEFNI